ncbi:MAG TPA: F0F1 ATP synthase subunit gamma [Gammaproteobacteria bacterium]|nr:F0F1 ATP synthase subunit gamma [Gammaproteobacteria bacterium]HQZ88377.1 F0F1 ATP synthase subunit gamma [Gammaproteobacteria bacterium]HRA43263.1 F0F1 ATP synthase subunit gamma [Gammaproteobacteria bacterium]
MLDAKEIRTKVSSIKNTQKITRAMQMVAASKMRKAQDRMHASRPYAEKVKVVISHLAQGRLEYKHPYLIEREPKRVGFMVVSTDRGLCGGLNANLLKVTVQDMRTWHEKETPIDICSIGKKAESFFKRMGGNIVSSVSNLGNKPSILDVIGTVKVMLDLYNEEKLDRIYLVYNKFINTVIQKPMLEMVLPIVDTTPSIENNGKFSWDYLYEPDAKGLLNALLVRYIESLVYQGIVENIACEQAARMIAMKNASDNASELIDELQLMYNKARQASITRELSEIVAGAAAV